MRAALFLVLLALPAQAQDTQVSFFCQNDACYLSKEDAQKVIRALEWADEKLRACGAI